MATERTAIDYNMLVKDDRVHGSVYVDPEIFEEEMEKIFISCNAVHRAMVKTASRQKFRRTFRLKK